MTTAVAATPVANMVRLIGSIICGPPKTSRCAVDNGIDIGLFVARVWVALKGGIGTARRDAALHNRIMD